MADRYWVGGTASWDGTAGSKWSLTSGGAGGEAIPTSADDVFFDAASGAVTVTIAAGNTGCRNLNYTGFTGTIAGSAALTISGSWTLGAGMTRTYTGALTFNATTGGQTITPNGITVGSTITFNGVGGVWTLSGNLVSTAAITVTNGSFDADGNDVTCAALSSNNSNTRTIDFGGSDLTLTSTGTIWNTATTTNLTLTAPDNLICSNATGTARTVNPGGATMGTLKVSAGTGTVTFSGGASWNDVDFTGFTGTWSSAVSYTIRGSLLLVSGMTWSSTGDITFASTTSGKTITCAGKALGCDLDFDGVGGVWTLQDALTTSGSIVVTNGTLNTNGQSVTTSVVAVVSGTLTLGASTVGLTGTGEVWQAGSSSTINAGTSTIKLTDASSSSKTFSSAARTYNNLWLTGAGTGTFIIGELSDLTFNDIKVDTPPHTVQFAAGVTFTIASLTIAGTAGNLMTLESTTPGTQAIITCPSGTVTVDYCDISDSAATGGGKFYATNSLSHLHGANNAGWFFGSPADEQAISLLAAA